MLETLHTLESSSATTVYALDETGISVESSNYLSWSPILENGRVEACGDIQDIFLK
ncbi:hypothetical protein [Clostridium sp.]|uniref:hypothetical protein n=1 Tax=Clostridium sp. TaxID=1506 RepID=UPI002FC9F4FC